MGNQEVSRRKVLSGIAATGGAGVLVGQGTTALFSDEETFTDNSIKASGSTAGIVDLEVDIENLQNADGTRYSISVPEGDNNNPSYIWVQAKCPTPIGAAEDIEVELRVECGSSQDYTIGSGELRDIVDSLRNGEILQCTDSDDDRCFQPGESVDLVLEVTDVETKSSLDFEFEFYGSQCRYNTGAENPFDPLPACDTPTPTPTPQNAVSFIAFCSESGDSLALNSASDMITVKTTDGDSNPLEVGWETDSPVDYVVVKSGQNFTIYDYADTNNEPDDGTVVTGGDSAADFYGRVYGDKNNGFTDESTGSGTNSGSANNASSVPCELAADIVGNGDFPDGGTSYKLEWNEDDNEFKGDSQ
jgi:predicted ribosomally synthesized peptide with SipW-like signal peptide